MKVIKIFPLWDPLWLQKKKMIFKTFHTLIEKLTFASEDSFFFKKDITFGGGRGYTLAVLKALNLFYVLMFLLEVYEIFKNAFAFRSQSKFKISHDMDFRTM